MKTAATPIMRPCRPMRCACFAIQCWRPRSYGFDRLKEAQWRLGDAVRKMLADKGVVSVAAEGFAAPGVVVSYTSDPSVHNGKAFAAEGMQIAAGVPLHV